MSKKKKVIKEVVCQGCSGRGWHYEPGDGDVYPPCHYPCMGCEGTGKMKLEEIYEEIEEDK